MESILFGIEFLFGIFLRTSWFCWLFMPASIWLMRRSVANGTPCQEVFGGPLQPIPMLPGIALAFGCGIALAAFSRAMSRWLLVRAAARLRRLHAAGDSELPGIAKPSSARGVSAPAAFPRIMCRAGDALAAAVPAAVAGGLLAMAVAMALRLYVWAAHAGLGAFGGPSAFPADIAPATAWGFEWLVVVVFGLALFSWLFRWAARLFGGGGESGMR